MLRIASTPAKTAQTVPVIQITAQTVPTLQITAQAVPVIQTTAQAVLLQTALTQAIIQTARPLLPAQLLIPEAG